jgi:2-dehydro-3-deoxyphosphogluconate aldolase / (4S)-4-hydroxy-2-oxoglutarate aldolase
MPFQTRQYIFDKFLQHRFMPLFNHDDVSVSQKVLQAAYDGGVRIFEFTNRSPKALAVFKELITYAEKNTPDMLMGVGTIVKVNDAVAYREAGAQFIVSPNIPLEVATYCEENNIFWCPGASTLNEILFAESLGADMVKIFPANFLGGPGYLKALRGPCPYLKVLITGGVEPNEENLKAWFDAGAIAVGMGSNLFDKKAIELGEFARIKEISKLVTKFIAQMNHKQ